MSQKILCVDDDPNILAGYQRTLRKQYVIETAQGAELAVNMMAARGPYAVVVSDMNMPGMNGIQFLAKAKEIAPETVRMMLTGNADLKTAIDAMHHGNVFRFLVKPFPAENLALALDAGLQQYRLITSERDLLEKTLRGSIRVLIEILSTIDPKIFGQAQLLKQNMRILADAMRASDKWKLELAAMLAQIGVVTLPPIIIQKMQNDRAMSDVEQNILVRVPEISHNLLVHIPRLEDVAKVILYHQKNYDGSGFPFDSVARDAIPAGARMLRVLVDLVKIEFGGISKKTALASMKRKVGFYDPKILEIATACFAPEENKPSAAFPKTPIPLCELKIGDVLAQDIEKSDGTLLISAGHRITETLLERIKNFIALTGIIEPIYIVPASSQIRKAA